MDVANDIKITLQFLENFTQSFPNNIQIKPTTSQRIHTYIVTPSIIFYRKQRAQHNTTNKHLLLLIFIYFGIDFHIQSNWQQFASTCGNFIVPQWE